MARALASYIDTFYFSEFQKKKGGLCSPQPTPKSALASASADVNNYCYSGFVNVMWILKVTAKPKVMENLKRS